MSSAASFETFEKELTRLVESFSHRLAELKKPTYGEAQLRADFLDPFFAALGWDMTNRAGLIQKHREVEIESRTEVAGRKKRADYLFRTDARDRFVCEAKKPAESLTAKYAFQAKRYAWNKDLALAILSDFEEIKIYIVGGRPRLDEPLIGLWKIWHFQEFPAAARELWDLLSRGGVAAGSIDRLIESLPKKPAGKGRAKDQWIIKPDRSRALDVDFLAFLDESRRALAADLLRHNDRADLLAGNQLNEAVQRILDRLLFLRICEDRDIDTGLRLDSMLALWRKQHADSAPDELREEPPAWYGASGVQAPRGTLWHKLVCHLRALDRRPPTHAPFFNGTLFKPHFSEELVVGDDWLATFLAKLGDEDSPYLFAVMPVEMLGSVYERFLGKVVRPHGRGVTIEEKPEVRKAGGVYYTPRYIVDYIVEQTVGKLLAEIASGAPSIARHEPSLSSAPAEQCSALRPSLKDFEKRTAALRLLDPACGSGSFLIRAFERVCEHWQQRLTTDLPTKEHKTERAAWEKKHRPLCWVDDRTGDVHLTVHLKRQILTQNIYGVDLDAAAVEVTQLSLYLKLLEDENRTTLARERELIAEAVALLPELKDNIKRGNSLIASDFSMMPEDLMRMHAFDWDVGFREIMRAGGFDAVVGNPPYNLLQPQNVAQEELDYYHQKFSGAQYKVDIYHLFIEQSLRLVRNNGQFSFITPAPFTTNNYTTNLRKLLLDTVRIRQLVTVPDGVFDQASVDNAIFTFQKSGDAKSRDENEIDFVEAGAGKEQLVIKERLSVQQAVFKTTPGMIFRPPKAAGFAAVETAFLRHSKLLGEVARVNFGMQLRDRKKFPDDVVETDKPRSLKASYRPCLTGRNVNRYVTEFANLYCLFDRVAQQGGCWDEAIQFAKSKVIVRQIGEIPIASFDAKGLCCLNTVFMIKATIPGLEERFLLGILNSKAMGFYWRNKFSDFKETFPKIKGTYLQQLPIPIADRSRQDKLVLLVDKLLALMPKLRGAKYDSEKAVLQNAVTATDQQIDALVYELYGLTPEEIALVEGTQ